MSIENTPQVPDQQDTAGNEGDGPAVSPSSKKTVEPTKVQSRPQFLNDWGGRAALGLQSAYNKLVAGRVNQLQSQIIDHDRELSELVHEMAEMKIQLTQMNRRVHELEKQQEELDSGDKTPDQE